MGAKLDLSNIDKTVVIDYYKTHSKKDTSLEFNISKQAIDLILKEFNFKKSKEERSITIKQGVLKKYGCENVFQAEEIKQKIKEECLKKYGVEYTAQTSLSKEHIQQTCLEKYGTTNGG